MRDPEEWFPSADEISELIAELAEFTIAAFCDAHTAVVTLLDACHDVGDFDVADRAIYERRVAAASEQIGIARAAFFPTVMLTAVAGLEGTSILNWFNWPSRLWAVGPSAVQTLFDAGRRRATSEAANAGFDAAAADYRESALAAFQQVEDNLAALRILETEAGQQHQAVVSAQESLQLFTNRYKGGVDTYLQVVTSETAALANERNETDIQRRRMEASVLLVKAVGGGWDTTQLPKL